MLVYVQGALNFVVHVCVIAKFACEIALAVHLAKQFACKIICLCDS